jgi:hypothetical protein
MSIQREANSNLICKNAAAISAAPITTMIMIMIFKDQNERKQRCS